MTDEHVIEIYAFAREAFRGGQEYFQVQAYPFRMTAENMAAHRDSEHYEYWEMLKVGYDHFELTKKPPKVDVCDRKYVFNQIAEDGEDFHATRACPPSEMPETLQLAYAAHQKEYDEEFARAVAELEKPIRSPAIASLLSPKPEAEQSDIIERAISVREARETNPEALVTGPLPGVSTTDTAAAVAVPTPSPVPSSDVATKGPRPKKAWWKVW